MALQLAKTAYVMEVGKITLSGDAKDVAKNDGVVKAYLGG
jgi:branched-chain amino acid transport system ATP-binding protein